jgi:hypothetical protein
VPASADPKAGPARRANLWRMFGDRIAPATSDAAAGWIRDAIGTSEWTVGAIVPNHYSSYVRVEAPDPTNGQGDWWDDYRDLFEAVASVGERHTSTPGRAWFAVWEGHGFDTSEAMNGIPRLELPNRSHYLLAGAVAAVTQLRYPGSPGAWRNPDLFWPDDRRWFVATDVDFWALYIGGTRRLISDLATRLPTSSEIVTLDRPLRFEV